MRRWSVLLRGFLYYLTMYKSSWAESNQRCALGWVSLHVAVLFHWYLRQSMNIV